MNPFTDRREAGRLLAAQLTEFSNRADVTVLAVPRGGIPVAYEVALALSLPLDVFIVRKVYALGPDPTEIGAVTSGGFEELDDATIDASGIDRRVAQREMARARQDLALQERMYRGTSRFPDLRGRTIIVVYDGIVTGRSMLAAVAALRERGAKQVVVAAPVATHAGRAAIERVADSCVSVVTAEPFYRIGVWYDDFGPVSDASVLFLLDNAARTLTAPAA